MSTLKKKVFTKANLFQNLITIFGIGKKSAIICCKYIGLQKFTNYKTLREEHIQKLLMHIEKVYPSIETSLKFQKKENTIYLEKVKNIRYIRNKLGLPSRGQRTHTNANTKKNLKNI